MAKEDFSHGAVVMSDQGEYLATEDGKRVFWSNSTEHAICFPNNKEAEKWLENWNNEHRHQPSMIISGVRIEPSVCNCGETRREIGSEPICDCDHVREANDGIEVSEEMVMVALKLLQGEETDIDELDDLNDEKEEIAEDIERYKEKLEKLNDKLEGIERKIARLTNRINDKLDAYFKPEVKKAILKKLAETED